MGRRIAGSIGCVAKFDLIDRSIPMILEMIIVYRGVDCEVLSPDILRLLYGRSLMLVGPPLKCKVNMNMFIQHGSTHTHCQPATFAFGPMC